MESNVPPHIMLQAGRAAKSALVQWYSGQWVRQTEEVGNLTNDLIEWYLETPATQQKMSALSEPEIMVTFRKRARQLLSRAVLEGNIFEGKVLYSSESVKDALKGETTNIYLRVVLPLAIERLDTQYREALAKRYTDLEFPQNKQEEDSQRRATAALTREINVLYITESVEGVGSSSVVFPETIKPKGDYSDPTAKLALTLMDQHPDFVDDYHYESPWAQVCLGAGAEPVIQFGPSGKYRLTAEEALLFRRVPGLLEMFIEQKQKEWADV
jgi:hypothetical protein